MKTARMLDWTWRLTVLALLVFCAVRLERLQGQAPVADALPAALTTTSDRLLAEQAERQALLRAARKAAGQSEEMAHRHP